MATVKIKSKSNPKAEVMEIDEKVWQQMQVHRPEQEMADSARFDVIEPVQKPKEVVEAAKKADKV